MMSASSRNRSLFTPNQWQELEQQALVFKYMVTGTPIPPDLIYSIKRSLDTSISSRIFPHPPSKYCYITLFIIFYEKRNTILYVVIIIYMCILYICCHNCEWCSWVGMF